MQYIIILPGESRRLPTAAQLRQAGFRISEAVAQHDPAQEHRPGDNDRTRNAQPQPVPTPALALAAEEPALYGSRRG